VLEVNQEGVDNTMSISSSVPSFSKAFFFLAQEDTFAAAIY